MEVHREPVLRKKKGLKRRKMFHADKGIYYIICMFIENWSMPAAKVIISETLDSFKKKLDDTFHSSSIH